MGAEAKDRGDETPNAALDGAGLDGESRESLADFFSQFSGGGHQFHVERLEPKQMIVGGKPRRTSGHLETTHTLPTPDYLRETYGGGLFKVRVFSNSGKGSRYAGSRRIEIAGDAKLRSDAIATEETPPAPSTESPAIVEKLYQDKWRAEDRADRELRELRQQAARAAQRPAVDPVIEAIRESSNAQLETLRLELQRRDREMGELRQQILAPRGDRSAFENPEVLKAVFGRGVEDAERLRDAHRQELAVERDRAARELSAERERAARELERAGRDLATERERAARDLAAERERASHELEAIRRDTANQLALVERLHRSDVENTKAAHQGLLATKDAEIARLSEEVRAVRAVASKPESITEQAAKVDQFLEVSQRIASRASGAAAPAAPVDDDGDDEPKPWYQSLFGRDGLVERVAERVILAPPPPPPTPPVRHNRPQLHVVRAPMVRREIMPAGPTAPTTATSAPTRPNLVEASATPTEAPMGDGESAAPVDNAPVAEVAPSGKLLQGLQFLETALRGGQPAATVARAANRLFDRDELVGLVTAGNDQLAAAIEQIAPESVLLSHQGRHYLGEFLGALKSDLPPAP